MPSIDGTSRLCKPLRVCFFIVFFLAAPVVFPLASAQAVVDTTPPNIINVSPIGWTGSTDIVISADYSDNGSGINPLTAYASLDGIKLTGCLVTISHISCPATGVTGDRHTISVGVKDNAGNLRAIFRTFGVDITPPGISDIEPSGWITDNSPTVEADLNDSQSGIDISAAFITLNDGPPLVDCSIISTHISCTTSDLPDGVYVIDVGVSDNAKNFKSVYGLFGIDTSGPQVSNIAPTGTIQNTNPVIEADILDEGAGVDTSTVKVLLNNSPLSGCNVTATNVSCPTNSLPDGHYNIQISADDILGNPGSGSGAFDIDTSMCGKTILSLSLPNSYWASLDDFNKRYLSVNWIVTNTGSKPAYDPEIVTSTNDDPVVLDTGLPSRLASRNPGPPESWSTTFVYKHVPEGIGSFRTAMTARANDACSASWPYP